MARFQRSVVRKTKLVGELEQAVSLRSMSAKVELAKQINGLLDSFNLSQLEAARRLGMPQSKISAIKNYKLHGISLERLMQALVSLDQHIEIVVTPNAERTNSITVQHVRRHYAERL